MINPCAGNPPLCGGGGSTPTPTPSTITIPACQIPYDNTTAPALSVAAIAAFCDFNYLGSQSGPFLMASLIEAAEAAGAKDVCSYYISHAIPEGISQSFSAKFNVAKYTANLTATNATELDHIYGYVDTYNASEALCPSVLAHMVSYFGNYYGYNLTAFNIHYPAVLTSCNILINGGLTSLAVSSDCTNSIIKFLAVSTATSTAVANWNAAAGLDEAINGGTGNAANSKLVLTVDSTSSLSAIDIMNVGTIELIFQAVNTFSAKYADSNVATLIFSNGLAVASGVSALNANPTIVIEDCAAIIPTITYAKNALSLSTLNLVIDDSVPATVTFNSASGDNNIPFTTVNITSICSDTDIPNTITSLTGTAVSTLTSLVINSNTDCGLTLPLPSTVNGIRTITYTGTATSAPWIITFADTQTSTQGHGLTATLPQGSTLGLGRTTAFDIVNDGTLVTFTGGNGTLQLGFGTAGLFPTSSVTSKYVGVTGLIITNALGAGTFDMSLIAGSTGLKTLTLTGGGAVTASTTIVTNLADISTINIGTINALVDTTGALVAGARFTCIASPTNGIINFNFFPVDTADVLTNAFTITQCKQMNVNIYSGDSTGIAASTMTLTSGGAINTVTFTSTGTPLATAVALTFVATTAASLTTINALHLGDMNIAFTHTLATPSVSTIYGSSSAVNTITGYATATSITIYGGAAADVFTSGVGGGAWTITGGGAADTYAITSTTAGTVMTITDFNPGTSSTAVDKLNLEYAVNLLGLTAAVLITGAGTAADVAAAGGFTFTSTSSTTATITAGTNGAAFTYTGGTLNTSSTVTGFSIGASDTGVVALVYKSSDDGFVHIGLLKYAAAATASSLTDVFILQNVTDVTLIDATDLLSIA